VISSAHEPPTHTQPSKSKLATRNPLTSVAPQEPTTSPLSPETHIRTTRIQEKTARIRASLEKEHAQTTDVSRRPATATAGNTRKPTSPIKRKREYNSWAARPSHTRTERNADRLPQTRQCAYRRASRTDYNDILEEEEEEEEDIEVIKQLSDRERYELFLEKDRKQTAVEQQRRAERKARGGFVGEVREKSDGLCAVM
jgi:hypothetical protein